MTLKRKQRPNVSLRYRHESLWPDWLQREGYTSRTDFLQSCIELFEGTMVAKDQHAEAAHAIRYCRQRKPE